MGMYEKRVHIRIPVGIEGSYQPIDRLEEPHLGITRDISLGGARFASTSRLEAGDRISLSLGLPREGEVMLTGLVVWSRPGEDRGGAPGYETGLSWQNVDAHAQARLNSFLMSYSRPEPVIISSGPAAPVISWSKLIGLSLLAGLLLSSLLFLGATVYEVSSENRSLKNAVQSYRHLIDHVAVRSARAL